MELGSKAEEKNR